jgi:nucleoside phosphorylase
VPFLEIRGVTDSADDAAVENFRKNLPAAMTNVASVIARLK